MITRCVTVKTGEDNKMVQIIVAGEEGIEGNFWSLQRHTDRHRGKHLVVTGVHKE